MKAFNRVNKHGIKFKFVELPGTRTEISLKNDYKRIVVDHSIDQVIMAWQDWCAGAFIQDAFAFLKTDEREFIKTGLIASEYDRLFGEVK